MGCKDVLGEGGIDGFGETPGKALATFAALADVTDAVMSLGSASSPATGHESDARVRSAWNVLGDRLRDCLLATKCVPLICRVIFDSNSETLFMIVSISSSRRTRFELALKAASVAAPHFSERM